MTERLIESFAGLGRVLNRAGQFVCGATYLIDVYGVFITNGTQIAG